MAELSYSFDHIQDKSKLGGGYSFSGIKNSCGQHRNYKREDRQLTGSYIGKWPHWWSLSIHVPQKCTNLVSTILTSMFKPEWQKHGQLTQLLRLWTECGNPRQLEGQQKQRYSIPMWRHLNLCIRVLANYTMDVKHTATAYQQTKFRTDHWT